MLASKEKISITQAMIILLCTSYSASMRFIVAVGAKEAKQAAWLSPVISFIIIFPIILIFQSIYKKYESQSFIDIIEDILGKIAGKVVTVFYAVLLTLVFTVNAYNTSDKLVATVFPNQNITMFIAVFLFAAAYIVPRGGIVVLARMSEIIILLLVSVFFILSTMALKDIEISRITPISHLDILPAFKTNIEILGVWSQFSFMFLFSNCINNKEKIRKVYTQGILLVTFLTMVVLVVCIGLLGAATVEISPVPYVTAVKQIAVFGALERLEAGELGLWIMSDFLLVSILLFAVLNVFKFLFGLSDTKPLVSIYSVIIFLLAVMVGRNVFEMQVFGYYIITSINIFLGFIIPVIVFTVGKVRKKI